MSTPESEIFHALLTFSLTVKENHHIGTTRYIHPPRPDRPGWRMKWLSALLNSATAQKPRRDTQPKRSSLLTKIPPEIRLSIYQHVLVSEFHGTDDQKASRKRLHVVRMKGRLGVVSCKNPDEHRFLEGRCWGAKFAVRERAQKANTRCLLPSSFEKL